MKIGYCLSNLLVGGVQTIMADLANEISKTHQVKYCLLSELNADPLVEDMFKNLERISPEDLLNWSDIIHLDGMNMKEQRRLFKKKWKQTVQHIGSARKKVKLFNRHLYSPNAVAVSKYVRKNLGRNHKLIYPAVDTELFKPMGLGKKYEVAFLGRLRKIKNPGLFLEICKKGNFSFLIVGGTHNREGYRMNKFEKEARMLAKEGRDLITGFVPHNDVPKFLNQARIVVVTSNSEALGFNCLESMACGIPVVARRVDGVPEAVGGDSDLLVPYDAPAEVYIEKIRKYIDDANLPTCVRDRALEKFSFKRMTKDYLELYREIYNKVSIIKDRKSKFLFWK